MERKNHTIVSNSEAETIAFASEFAKILRGSDVVLLNGTLGMGKSVLSRAVLRALCNDINLEVPSPTFTLVQTYDAPDFEIWHMDLYRLSEPDEVYELGWEEAFGQSLMLIEWPERLGYLRPKSYISLTLSAIEGQADARKIEVSFIHDAN